MMTLTRFPLAIVLALLLLSICLPASAQPWNDDISNAGTINHPGSSCCFDMGGATSVSGWSADVWFTFQATASYVSVKLNRVGGPYVNLQVALRNSNQNLMAEALGTFNKDLGFSYDGLTVGDWYYIGITEFTGQGVPATNGISYGVELSDQPGNDYRSAAIELFPDSNMCPDNTVYNTITASGSEWGSTCHSNPTKNVWFKFTATSNSASVKLLEAGSGGSNGLPGPAMPFPRLAVFDDQGNEIACDQGSNSDLECEVSSSTLLMGSEYYISVDISGSHNAGNFGLCIDAATGFDSKTDPIILTNITDYCSGPGGYSNVGATPDGTNSCHTAKENVWFKFQASTNYIFARATRSSGSSMKRPFLTLWDANFQELDCNGYPFTPYSNFYTGEGVVESNNLTPGAWYYLSVDSYEWSYSQGTFELCVNDDPTGNLHATPHQLPAGAGWCSQDAEFTFDYGTADSLHASCKVSTASFSQWHEFTATTEHVRIIAQTGGNFGTANSPVLGLWDTQGNQLACGNGGAASTWTSTEVVGQFLTIGDNYLISVDKEGANWGARGSYSLCIDTAMCSDSANCAIATNLRTTVIHDTTATLGWDPVECGVSAYKILYKVAGGSSWNVAWKYANVGKLVLDNLQPSTTYKWRIRTKCGNGYSGYSPLKTFKTLAQPCGVPANLTGSPVQTTQARLNWDPVPGAVKYRIRYQITPPLGAPVYELEKPASFTSHWITGITPSNWINFQVKAFCQYGNVGGMEWSDVQYVNYSYSNKYDTSVTWQTDAASTFTLFPNPAKDALQLAGSAVAEALQVELLSTLGQVVQTTSLHGSELETLPLDGLPRGVYFVRLVGGADLPVQKLVLD